MAGLAGVRPAAITKLLRSQPDVTALTITKLAVALGQVPHSMEWQARQGRLTELRGYSRTASAPADQSASGFLQIAKGRVATTVEAFPHVLVDLDEHGSPLSVEVVSLLRPDADKNPAASLLAWLSEHIHMQQASDDQLVVTPFLNHRNDGIEYYVETGSDGHQLLHDNGTALNNLEMSGVELEAAMPHVRRILNRTGVELVDRRLELGSARLGLGLAQLRFVQCLQSIDHICSSG